MTDELVRPPMPAAPPWPDVSPLHDHPLASELDVPGRLQWIDAMIGRRSLGADSKADAKFFEDVRRRIERRQRESRLFLGVVGEFSSGKSTLINALIRRRLLRTDILQGTTAAATLITFGETFTVEIRRRRKNVLIRAATAVRDGVSAVAAMFRKPKPPPTRRELLELLHQATSEESFARDIVQVDVSLPAESLSDGVVIVDTPGANAENPRHAQVTAMALRDVCDAAIVAVPADAAGSESLLDFLKTHASDVLHRCVFLITKADLVRREKERVQVIENLTARLRRELGLANPRVLAAAPQFVIETLPPEECDFENGPGGEERGEYADDQIDRWVRHFAEMESDLRALLKEKRLQAQADDIGKLLRQLYERLKEALGTRLKDYQTRHEALERVVIPDIQRFIDDKRTKHTAKARSAVERVVRSLPGELNDLGVRVVHDLHGAISNASNSSELKSLMESGVHGIIRNGESRIQRHVNSVLRRIATTVQGELKVFHGEFQKHYRSLATLGGSLRIEGGAPTVAMKQFAADSTSLSANLAASVQASRNEQNQRVVGGGAAGAVIGTFLAPGVGTVIGGLAGSLFSSMFGPSLQELKDRCWQPLGRTVGKRLDEAIAETVASVEHAANRSLQTLAGSIADYAPKYQQLVEEMRGRDASEKAKLVELQRSIEADLALIDEQQSILNDIQGRIRDM